MATLLTMVGCQSLEISGGAFEVPKTEILSKSWPAQVVGVTDGDTIKVRLQGEGEQLRVRLYGLDAPEKKQPYGGQATEFLRELSLISPTITIKPVNFDRYGRLVAIVYGSDGRCFNADLVEVGLAWVYPQYCRQSVCSSWGQLEELARHNRAGLWVEAHPTPPWEWRKQISKQKR